ncbi:MAG: hypothetical protein D3906_11470, partial [Candidatus Electrothrix sp. AUS1_2]|nr:hypothetical protein [Candidatus Electrothrix sp. AUS1_2]
MFCKAFFFIRYRCSRFSLQTTFFLLLLISPVAAQALSLDVTVQGVKGEEQKNIMASLKITRQKDNPDLTARHIRRMHKAAPEEIAEALAPFGYYSVEVKDGGSLTKDKTGWHAVYQVIPGPPVLVDRISIEVAGPGKDEKFFGSLEQQFPLKKGEQLRDTLYEQGKKNILATALSNGYIRAGFSESSVLVHKKEHRAEIKLRLATGSLFFFGRTTSVQDIIMPDTL